MLFNNFSFYICQIKRLKHISTFLAALIILLHSLIAHQHFGPAAVSTIYSCENKGCQMWDFIKNSVKFDAGTDHLDHYTSEKVALHKILLTQDFIPFSSNPTIFDSPNLSILLNTVNCHLGFVPKYHDAFTSSGLRGPPTSSLA